MSLVHIYMYILHQNIITKVLCMQLESLQPNFCNHILKTHSLVAMPKLTEFER